MSIDYIFLNINKFYVLLFKKENIIVKIMAIGIIIKYINISKKYINGGIKSRK